MSIDDATSQLMQLRFARIESTFAYFGVLRRYLKTWGRPVAFPDVQPPVAEWQSLAI